MCFIFLPADGDILALLIFAKTSEMTCETLKACLLSWLEPAQSCFETQLVIYKKKKKKVKTIIFIGIIKHKKIIVMASKPRECVNAEGWQHRSLVKFGTSFLVTV